MFACRCQPELSLHLPIDALQAVSTAAHPQNRFSDEGDSLGSPSSGGLCLHQACGVLSLVWVDEECQSCGGLVDEREGSWSEEVWWMSVKALGLRRSGG